jgi:hypothetical protein
MLLHLSGFPTSRNSPCDGKSDHGLFLLDLSYIIFNYSITTSQVKSTSVSPSKTVEVPDLVSG